MDAQGTGIGKLFAKWFEILLPLFQIVLKVHAQNTEEQLPLRMTGTVDAYRLMARVTIGIMRNMAGVGVNNALSLSTRPLYFLSTLITDYL